MTHDEATRLVDAMVASIAQMTIRRLGVSPHPDYDLPIYDDEGAERIKHRVWERLVELADLHEEIADGRLVRLPVDSRKSD